MALSDKGELADAERYLRLSVFERPSDINTLVALGVVLQRQGRNEAAIETLESAAQIDADNPWAHRNLGGCLLKAGRFAEAERHLLRTVEIDSTDQKAVFGLAQIAEARDQVEKADELYRTVIRINESSEIAEMARTGLTTLAEKSFRSHLFRMDAVMYLTSAIQKFEKMDRKQVQTITFEIAVKGQSGLDTNSLDQKYELKSLPGQFSGLHLVCIMFVGFKILMPNEQTGGFDLSKEYEMALSLK